MRRNGEESVTDNGKNKINIHQPSNDRIIRSNIIIFWDNVALFFSLKGFLHQNPAPIHQSSEKLAIFIDQDLTGPSVFDTGINGKNTTIEQCQNMILRSMSHHHMIYAPPLKDGIYIVCCQVFIIKISPVPYRSIRGGQKPKQL